MSSIRCTYSMPALLIALAACGRSTEPKEITETITRSEHRPPVEATDSVEEQLGLDRFREPRPMTAEDPAGADQMPEPMQVAAAGPSPFEYETPEGWTEVAPTQFRNPNFVAGPQQTVEAYVSVMPGGAGGLLMNANRWRNQMGAPPISPDELAALPRISMLDGEAVLMDVAGTFTGMRGDRHPNYRLLGTLYESLERSVFVKMVGPDEAVRSEAENLRAFAASLREPGQPAPAAPEDMPDEAAELEGAAPSRIVEVDPDAEQQAPGNIDGAADSAQGFAWSAPEDWRKADTGSPMRLVTYRLGPGGAGECYVTVLGGTGGGRLNNLNRWLGQFGQPPLEESELELQPKVELFGEQVPMLIASGTFKDMFADQPQSGYALLGATAELDDRSVFVKLVGPEAIVNSEWENFRYFCSSFTQE